MFYSAVPVDTRYAAIFQPFAAKNLSPEDKKYIDDTIQALTADKKNPYRSNMALLLCAQVEGYTDRYHDISSTWRQPISAKVTKETSELSAENKWMGEPAARGWFDARANLAAVYAGYDPKYLWQLQPATSVVDDAMTQWRYAYLASVSEELYKNFSKAAIAGAVAVTNKYTKMQKAGASTPEALQSVRSDALWCWVMTLYAAATKGDFAVYKRAKEEICRIGETKSLSHALTRGLLRLASNDYPAWALGLALQAAVLMNDDRKELTIQLATQISAAKNVASGFAGAMPPDSKTDIDPNKVKLEARAEVALALVSQGLAMKLQTRLQRQISTAVKSMPTSADARPPVSRL